ncbi:MAG: B12-binding domain-containing protein [Arenibacterium sp.]
MRLRTKGWTSASTPASIRRLIDTYRDSSTPVLAARKQAAVTQFAHVALDVLASNSRKSGRNAPVVSNYCIEAFSTLLLAGDMRSALEITRMFRLRGAEYSEIAENLFTPALRQMGERWRLDRASMIEVHLGVSTLKRTNTAFCASLGEWPEPVSAKILLGAIAGQDHTLGIYLAAEVFRQNGWIVSELTAARPDAILKAAKEQMPDVVGLTATTDSDLHLVQPMINALKQLPSAPRVIVGGSAPNLSRLRADAIVQTFDMGLIAAYSLLRK